MDRENSGGIVQRKFHYFTQKEQVEYLWQWRFSPRPPEFASFSPHSLVSSTGCASDLCLAVLDLDLLGFDPAQPFSSIDLLLELDLFLLFPPETLCCTN